MTTRPRFHLAFPVTDLVATRAFYEGLLGCGVGRTASRWIDFDWHGHQLSAHLVDHRARSVGANAVDGDAVPVPHWGLILPPAVWTELAGRLERAGVPFVIPPQVRFEGQPGEQSTMFVRDPSGNVLELKSFADDGDVFRTA